MAAQALDLGSASFRRSKLSCRQGFGARIQHNRAFFLGAGGGGGGRGVGLLGLVGQPRHSSPEPAQPNPPWRHLAPRRCFSTASEFTWELATCMRSPKRNPIKEGEPFIPSSGRLDKLSPVVSLAFAHLALRHEPETERQEPCSAMGSRRRVRSLHGRN